jgi:hypothetical protein
LTLVLSTVERLVLGSERTRMPERTLETLWRSIEEPDLVVLCTRLGQVEPAPAEA